MPTGTTVAPVRAARKATPSWRSCDHRPGATLTLGEQDEHLAGVEDLLGPAQRLAVGRLAVDGEGPDRGKDPGQQTVLPQAVLGHVVELARRDLGGHEEVDERPVDRGDDHRARGRHLVGPSTVVRNSRRLSPRTSTRRNR